MISTSVLNFLMEISVLSFVFPVVILLAWRMRTRKSLVPAFAGILVFLVFAKIFESIPYALFVGMENPISKVILSNEILYAAYQGIAAAIFEEIGRYLAFRYFLTKYDNRQTAITYGIGHGGIECMIVLGWTNLQYYVTATILNEGKGLTEVPKSMQAYLKNLTSFDCVLDGISQIFFFGLQIGLSILVFQAFRNEKLRNRLLFIAMGLHAVSYLPNGLYQANMLPHIICLLLQILVLGITLVIASDIYKKMGINEENKKAEQKKKESMTKENNWSYAKKKLSNMGDDKSTGK